MTPRHYIWLVLYDLSLMTMRSKIPCQTLKDCLSFAIHPLQLRAFSHIMSDMTTKLLIYGVIDLRISSSANKYHAANVFWKYMEENWQHKSHMWVVGF